MRRIFSWTETFPRGFQRQGGEAFVCLQSILATEEEIVLLLIGCIEGRMEYATVAVMMVDVSDTSFHPLLTRNFLHILGRTSVN